MEECFKNKYYCRLGRVSPLVNEKVVTLWHLPFQQKENGFIAPVKICMRLSHCIPPFLLPITTQSLGPGSLEFFYFFFFLFLFLCLSSFPIWTYLFIFMSSFIFLIFLLILYVFICIYLFTHTHSPFIL